MSNRQRTAVSVAAAQAAVLLGGLAAGIAFAQTAPAPAPKPDPKPEAQIETVVVSGKRAALSSAQKIKQNSDEIVDSIVADDIGKLPDRSVTEVLQRIVGVTMDRTMAKGDPEHFSVEGSGISIRGLTYVRSEMNGRDSFSANGGRSLNFEDVPPELMAAVDVYKNPSAEQIEGSIGGLVNLRTAMPFDFDGLKTALSLQTTYSDLKEKSSPSVSGMVSNRWKTDLGEFGALVNIASSRSGTRTDAFQVEPYYPRTDAVVGQDPNTTLWIPKGSQWRTLEFDRKRQGLYGALQWKKDDVDSSLTYFRSKYRMQWDERAIFAQSDPYKLQVANGEFGKNGQLLYGTLSNSDGSGINFGADTRSAYRNSETQDLAWKLNWRANEQWSFSSDLQYIRVNGTLQIGQRLRIPSGGAPDDAGQTFVHTVRRGESLYRIANRYSVTVDEICTPEETARVIDRNTRFVRDCQAIVAGHHVPAHVVQCGAKGCVTWSERPVRNYRDYKRTDFTLAFAQWIHGINRGVLLPPGLDEQWLISAMHDDADATAYATVFEEFVTELTS